MVWWFFWVGFRLGLSFVGGGSGGAVIEHLACAGAGLGRANDAFLFHGFDHASGAGIADAQAALQHGDRGAPMAADQVDRLVHQRIFVLFVDDVIPHGQLLEGNVGREGVHNPPYGHLGGGGRAGKALPVLHQALDLAV